MMMYIMLITLLFLIIDCTPAILKTDVILLIVFENNVGGLFVGIMHVVFQI